MEPKHPQKNTRSSSKKVMSDMMIPGKQLQKKLDQPRKSSRITTQARSIASEKKDSEILSRQVPSHRTWEADVADYVKLEQENPVQKTKKVGCALWLLIPLCIAAVTLVVGGLIVSTRIEITPKKYTGMVDVSTVLVLDPSLSGLNGGEKLKSKNSLSFYTATKVFTQSQTVPGIVGGTKEAFATGSVRFYNTQPKAVTIPQGTLLTDSSGEIVFVTKKSVVVPAGSVKVSGQKDAVITAQIPGTRSNIGLSDFQLIKPMKGITVRGVTPVSGGIQSTDRTVSPEIDSQIRTELTQSFDLNDVLVQRMKEELPDTMLALPISFIAGEPSFSYSSEGESSVMITAQKRIVITMVARSDIAQLLGSRMSAPENNKLTLDSFDGLTVTTTALGSPTNIPKTLPIRITGVGTVYGSIDQKSLIDQITGKSKSETKAILAQKSEIGTFDIHMMPFWRRILPLDAEKISVTVLNP